MHMNKQVRLRRWLLALGVATALAGGAAYAMNKECWSCTPCGCSSDGGHLMCCDAHSC
jgi:hypothetical protein